MTRAYAALRLLEHGPLIFRDFVQITGWGVSASSLVLQRLAASGEVIHKNIGGKRHYLKYE